MRKITGAVSALAIVGAVLVGGANVASADTAPIDQCVPADAWTETVETTPAWTETVEHEAVTTTVDHPAVTETVEHPAVYETVEVTPAVPEVPEVSHTEYEFRHAILIWKTRWETDPNWNANGNPNSLGWFSTGETRVVVTQEYVPGVPAVTEERLVTEAWTEEVVVTEAWTETVVVTEAWTETIEHPAVTEEVEHPAVKCGAYEVTFALPTDVAPATCEAPGSIGWLDGGTAINDGGWEFDGYRIFPVGDRYEPGAVGEFSFTVQKVGAGVSASYPNGTVLVDENGVKRHPNNGNASWTVTVPDVLAEQSDDPDAECYVAPEPTEPEPEPTTPPAPVDPSDPTTPVTNPVVSTPQPSATPKAAGPVIRAGENTLATTGLDVVAIGGAGAVILLIGVGTVLAVRRFTAHD